MVSYKENKINDAIIKCLKAIEKVINNSLLVDDFESVGIFDTGVILDTVPSDIGIIDPGTII